jgi:hypothetical protein
MTTEAISVTVPRVGVDDQSTQLKFIVRVPYACPAIDRRQRRRRRMVVERKIGSVPPP